jgi:hypothetical protein
VVASHAPFTLLDLIEAVNDLTESEEVALATVTHMLRTGAARLRRASIVVG